jgi:hypothetical protein
MKMPINLDAFKGRGSDKDGAVKQWRDPLSGRVPAPTDGPAASAKPTNIDKLVDKASKRNTDDSTDA